MPRVKRESVVVDSVGKIDPSYRSKRRAAEPAVGWPISCQSNWLAGRVPGHGRGGGEPCARLALPALHRTCIHASKRGSVHACPCNACNPFDRVRREGVHPSGKASSSASARSCANPWVRNAHPRARTRAPSSYTRTHVHTLTRIVLIRAGAYIAERPTARQGPTNGETETALRYIRERMRVHVCTNARLVVVQAVTLPRCRWTEYQGCT